MARNDLRSTLPMYGVDSQMLRALKSLYVKSRACIHVNGAQTDWFDISRSVSQGRVASPWLFNLFIYISLMDLNYFELGLRLGELSMKCLLHAADLVLLASTVEELQEIVSLMNEGFK